MKGNKLFRFIDTWIGIPVCIVLGLFNKLFGYSKKISTTSLEKILVIKLSALGDTVLLMPALRGLRKHFPKAHISMVVTSINEQVVKNCPYLDEVFLLDIKQIIRNPIKFFGFMKLLRNKKFDMTFDFDQWLRISPIICYLTGAKQRIGFKTKGQYRHYLYSISIPHSQDKHEVECFLDIVRALGLEVSEKYLELWIPSDGKEKIKNFLAGYNITDKDIVIGIHPGCGPNGWLREWYPERYAKLADIFISEYKVKIVITGDINEIKLAEKISSLMSESPIITSGKFSFGEFPALIKRLNLLICGNTGVMHVAVALGIPTIVLTGPTDPKKWGPWGEGHNIIRKELPCSPCLYLGFEYGCKKHTCMDLISVEDVLRVVKSKFIDLWRQ